MTVDVAAIQAELAELTARRVNEVPVQSNDLPPLPLSEALEQFSVSTWGTKPKAPFPVRLLRKLKEDENGCWLWTSTLDREGYGRMRIFGGPNLLVHRAVYELLVGPIPDGLPLDHLCKVRHCASPAHLEPVTPAENVRRSNSAQASRERAGLVFCGRGHLREENWAYKPNGTRYCGACKQQYNRLYHQGRSESPAAALMHRVARVIRDENLPPASVTVTVNGEVRVDATGTELVESNVRRWAAALGLLVVELPSEVNGFAATMWEASGYDGTSVWWRVHGTELLPTTMVDRFGVGLPS